jgi:5-methylcytosine-specific restriction endonuclease McrA
MELTMSEEQFETLKQATEFLSHVAHENSWADVIAELASRFVKSKTGNRNTKSKSIVESALDVKSASGLKSGAASGLESQLNSTSEVRLKSKLKSTSCATAAKSHKESEIKTLARTSEMTKNTQAKRRKYISVHTKRFLLNKANHCCEYVNPETKLRCGSSYQLQLDHVWPRAFGGGDDKQNLRVLCGNHNRFEARRIGVGR